MENPVKAVLYARQPSGDVTSECKGDTAADDPPYAGAHTKAAGRRRTAAVDVNLAQANATAPEAQKELNRHRQNDAAEDSRPGDAAVSMGPTAHHRRRRFAQKMGAGRRVAASRHGVLQKLRRPRAPQH